MMRRERISTDRKGRADMLLSAAWTRVEKLLLVFVCALTLFFAIMTPPFQAPDENQHYMKAIALTQGQMFAQHRGEAVGAELPLSALAIHSVDFPTDTPRVL